MHPHQFAPSDGPGRFRQGHCGMPRHGAGKGAPHGGPGCHGHHGGHGGGFGFDGDGGEMSRGRKFSSDDLQLICLALLGEEPCHGYDLIRLVATRSNGFYKPSPGMIYPALTYLEEIEYVGVTADGARKRYTLTDAGRRHLDGRRSEVEVLFAKLEKFAQKMTLIRRAFEQGPTDENGQPNALPELLAASQAMRMAVHARDLATPDEQRRVAAILRRALAEIEQEAQPKA